MNPYTLAALLSHLARAILLHQKSIVGLAVNFRGTIPREMAAGF